MNMESGAFISFDIAGRYHGRINIKLKRGYVWNSNYIKFIMK